MSKIFRKTSIEYISGPDKLDQLVHIVPKKAWLFYLALCLTIIALVVWLFLGRLTSSVETPCIFFPNYKISLKNSEKGDDIGQIFAHAFLDRENALKIDKGMKTFLYLAKPDTQNQSYLQGQVFDIIEHPNISNRIKEVTYLDLFNKMTSNTSFEVLISLEEKQKNIKIGELGDAKIIVSKIAPIQFLFPGLFNFLFSKYKI